MHVVRAGDLFSGRQVGGRQAKPVESGGGSGGGMGWVETTPDVTESQRERMGWDGMGRSGMGWNGTGRGGMGWNGTG